MAKKSNYPIIRPNAQIGEINAEDDDEFLSQCFVHHPAIERLTSSNSPAMLIAGRTGAGKTAILKHIEQKNATSATLDLLHLSMEYISNSDILRFLLKLDVNLDLFFQALWKHVLCIEYIRLKYKVNDEAKSRFTFNQIADFFQRDDRKIQAVKYLKEWENKFWITMDENIKQVTETYETKLTAEMGSEFEKFKAKGGYDKQLSTEKKHELSARAKKIINAGQITELHRVIDLLSEHGKNNTSDKARFFILIDKLDENWIEDAFRFKLIAALIETLKTFRKIHDLKIIVAIRTDVLERVVQEGVHIGFQREKYDAYSIKLDWSADSLKDLINKRMRFLYKMKYTREDVDFDDVFSYSIGRVPPFEFIVDRTLFRPRDVISFVNLCLLNAQGRTEIAAKIVRDSESEYSRIRRQAVIDEWSSAFPNLTLMLDFFNGKNGSILVEDIAVKQLIDELALPICGERKIAFDPMFELAERVINCSDRTNFSPIFQFAQKMIEILYRVGVLGVKRKSDEKFLWSHKAIPVVDAATIALDTRVRVHPMLYRAMSIEPNS